MKRQYLALLILAFMIIVLPVSAGPDFNQSFDTGDEIHYNVTSRMDTGKTTPIEIWAVSALLGLALFLFSLPPKQTTGELEHTAIVSVLAWIPIGFTALTSFAVDRITSYGVTGVAENSTSAVQEFVLMEHHTIYHFDVLGYLYGIFFVIAIINTIRILALHKSLKLQSDTGTDSVRGNY